MTVVQELRAQLERVALDPAMAMSYVEWALSAEAASVLVDPWMRVLSLDSWPERGLDHGDRMAILSMAIRQAVVTRSP